jgi:integrase
MPWPKKSKRKAERVVRRKMQDGTVREYRYDAYQAKPKPKRSDTLSGLIDAWKDSPEWRGLAKQTRTSYTIYLRPLDRIGHLDPATIKRRDILTLRDALAAASGNAAANAFVVTASQLFAWAVGREWLEQTPILKIKALPTGHLPAWSPDQAEAALQKLREHMRRVVVLGMFTGQRRGDLGAMRWDAYDGERISVTQQKTGAELRIPVHPALKAELDTWKRGATALTILTNANGVPWKGNSLSYHMPAALARIGLPDTLNVHGLRKLAAANLADAGCSTHEIAAITGHKTLAMVELYTRSANQAKLAGSAIVCLSDLQKTYNLQSHGENKMKSIT